MPCDRTLRPNETIQQRKETIREAMKKIERGLALGTIKPAIGPQGAIAFLGIDDGDRAGVTDNCAYRRIMATGSALAKQAILKAEQLSGRSVNKQVVGQGAHSHDGGKNWHSHKG
jgi:hypothetical protein